MARPLVRAVFALLVVATIAAFFVTQQLKSEDALVLRFAAQPKQFSPNGDGTRDRSRIGFDLSRPATVSFYVLDGEGNEIRQVVDDRALAGDTKHRFTWDGRDDDGVPVPDGFYRMRVVQRSEGRVINSSKRIKVDRRPPEVVLLETAPGVIAPREPGQDVEVVVRYRGPSNSAPEFRVFRTDLAGEPLVVRRFRGNDDRRGVWHGEVASGPQQTEPAPDGDYAFTVTVRDKAGNPVVAPEEIPRPETARAGTGVSVRSFTLSGPLEVVSAGSAATLKVGPIDRSFDFVMSRYGDPEPIRSGGRIAGEFRVHVPSDARTGVYLVRVRAGRHRAVWPLAVAGLPQTRRGAERARPLVVLPAMSWQGRNAVDDDLDGFADTLPDGRSVGLTGRPFRSGGLPPRFASEVGPLLRYLDRESLAYDLTTDVSLARGEGPSPGNAPGLALARSALWLHEPLMRPLRDEVQDGLRVASFGADALRRTVRLREAPRDGEAGQASGGGPGACAPGWHPPIASLRAVIKWVAAGVVALAVLGGIAYYLLDEEDPIKKRGSRTDEFVTTEPEEPKAPPKKENPRPWPTYSYDDQRRHISPYDHRPPYRRLWTIDAHDPLEFPTAVGYGKVFLAQQKGLFFALDDQTGRVHWRKSFGRCAASSPTIGKGVVYQSWMHPVVCEQGQEGADGFVVAWDAETGRERWRFKSAPIESSPLLKGNRLFVGSWDHGVYALNANNGKRMWSEGSAREFYYATPTVAHGRVYLGSTDGTMYVFGAKTGRLLWARPLGSYIYGAAAVYKRKVFVGTYDGQFYALDAATGDTRWQIDAGGTVHAAPTVMDGLVYYAICSTCGSEAQRAVAGGTDSTYAVRAKDGKRVWRFPGGKYANPVVADEDRIYITGRSFQYGLAERGSSAAARDAKRDRRG